MTAEPLLRELYTETPWPLGQLEHAISRGRVADMDDAEIRRLIHQGGPGMVHAYVAVLNSHMLYDCWCGERHWKDPLEPDEASRNLGHLIITELRIPQLVAWLVRTWNRLMLAIWHWEHPDHNKEDA